MVGRILAIGWMTLGGALAFWARIDGVDAGAGLEAMGLVPLAGVFPLRLQTTEGVASRLAELALFDLPHDLVAILEAQELARAKRIPIFIPRTPLVRLCGSSLLRRGDFGNRQPFRDARRSLHTCIGCARCESS